MSHPVSSAARPAPPASSQGRIRALTAASIGEGTSACGEPWDRTTSGDVLTRPGVWAVRQDDGPEIAVLLTACPDIAATVRCYRTILPLAKVFLYGDDLSCEARAAAERAGAVPCPVPPCGRTALVRRMLAEVDADIYLLAHGAGPEEACLAPLMVAEIDRGERDFVDLCRLTQGRPAGDLGDRLLSRTVDFLFGRGGDMLVSDAKACSRRFALSYRATASGRGADLASALDLALHALRLRLPVGSIASFGAAPAAPAPPVRSPAGWAALLGLVGRLLVEERPRRVLGLLGLAIVAAGVGAALPALKFHHWRATLPLCPETILALGLMTVGAAVGVAGAALDSLAEARQEVKRVGIAAIPRRGERHVEPHDPGRARVPEARSDTVCGRPQSSVS